MLNEGEKDNEDDWKRRDCIDGPWGYRGDDCVGDWVEFVGEV